MKKYYVLEIGYISKNFRINKDFLSQYQELADANTIGFTNYKQAKEQAKIFMEKNNNCYALICEAATADAEELKQIKLYGAFDDMIFIKETTTYMHLKPTEKIEIIDEM